METSSTSSLFDFESLEFYKNKNNQGVNSGMPC